MQHNNDATLVVASSFGIVVDAQHPDNRKAEGPGVPVIGQPARGHERVQPTQDPQDQHATSRTVPKVQRKCVFDGEAESDYARGAPSMILVEFEAGQNPVAALLPDWRLSQQLQAAVRAERDVREERRKHSSQLNSLRSFQHWSFELRSKLLDLEASRGKDDEDLNSANERHGRLLALQRRESEARKDEKIIQQRLKAVEAEARVTQTAAARAQDPIFVECNLMAPADTSFAKTAWDRHFDQRYAMEERSGLRSVDGDVFDTNIVARLNARNQLNAAEQAFESAQAAFNRREASAEQEFEAMQWQSPVRDSSDTIESRSQFDQHQLKMQRALYRELVSAEQALEVAKLKSAAVDAPGDDEGSESSSTSTVVEERPACMARTPAWARIHAWRRTMSLSSSSAPTLVQGHGEQAGTQPDFEYDDGGMWGSVSQASGHTKVKRSKVSEWQAVCDEVRATLATAAE